MRFDPQPLDPIEQLTQDAFRAKRAKIMRVQEVGGLEPVFTAQQVAAWLNVSPQTVRRIFKGDRAVIELTTHKQRRGSREYTKLRIPRSALLSRFPSLASLLPR